MKKQVRFLLTFIALAISFSASAFNSYVSFTGSGASTTVDSVIVQNLSKSTQVTVPLLSRLRLYDVETSVNQLNTITDLACVYPNPMTDNATFSFVAKNDGNTQVSVFSLDGRKVTEINMDLLQGKNSFQLSLPKGVYLVQAKGNGYSYTTKTISLSMSDSRPMISFSGSITESKPQRVGAPEVKLQYTPGEQILYKGYSGNHCTIVTDKPTETKTTDFKFVDCMDADGNRYAVVQIGEQTWMAENLRTTKYRNGDEIGTTTSTTIPNDATSKYQWAYVGTKANVNKYGRLYTWYAATDSRYIAPVGWHVASDAEWTTLTDYVSAHLGTSLNVSKALAATTDWTTNSTTGAIGCNLTLNNATGFSALPSGSRYDDGSFYSIGNYGYWWSSTQYDTTLAWYRGMGYNYDAVGGGNYSKSNGLSVRCVKD